MEARIFRLKEQLQKLQKKLEKGKVNYFGIEKTTLFREENILSRHF